MYQILCRGCFKPYNSVRAVGMLKDSEGFLLKSALTQREVDFYETLRKTEDHVLLELKRLVPRYERSKLDEYWQIK